jgi:hypothetical protein
MARVHAYRHSVGLPCEPDGQTRGGRAGQILKSLPPRTGQDPRYTLPRNSKWVSGREKDGFFNAWTKAKT